MCSSCYNNNAKIADILYYGYADLEDRAEGFLRGTLRVFLKECLSGIVVEALYWVGGEIVESCDIFFGSVAASSCLVGIKVIALEGLIGTKNILAVHE